MANSEGIWVTVAYSPAPGRVIEKLVQVAKEGTLDDAVRASGILIQWPELVTAAHHCGVWGSRVVAGHRLQEGDRVEIYRPLTVDPKVARRQRFSKQGARTAGLFARSSTKAAR